MSRPQFQSPRPKLMAPNSQPKERVLIGEARVNTGMSSSVDPADLPGTYLRLAKNARIKNDLTRRRPGTVISGPTKPNSDRVLLYTVCNRFDGTAVYLRFTANATHLHRQGAGSWTAITGAALGFTTTSRPKLFTLNDRFFFLTGADEIQEINLTANTYADLGNAPKYKYACGFFNRIVGANLYSTSAPNPTLIGWSGDLNLGEWDPLTDISAGSTPLLEAQADFADPITGLFGFAQVMLVLREHSLWLASKRPVASNPFQFQAAFPSVGCDTPDSATQKRNGLIWYDRRSNQVYDYTIGSAPTPIGDSIRKELSSRVGSVSGVSGTYDFAEDQYHLLVFSESSAITTVFVYDFRRQGWTFDEIPNAYSISSLDGGLQALYIDDLVGMIDDLVGTIDSLGSDTATEENIFYGRTDGSLLEADHTVDTDDGVEVKLELESKIFALPSSDISVNRTFFKIDVSIPTNLSLFYSRDGGASWILGKTLSVIETGRHILTVSRHITTSEYAWKITSALGSFDLLEYRIEGLANAITKQNP